MLSSNLAMQRFDIRSDEASKSSDYPNKINKVDIVFIIFQDFL